MFTSRAINPSVAEPLWTDMGRLKCSRIHDAAAEGQALLLGQVLDELAATDEVSRQPMPLLPSLKTLLFQGSIQCSCHALIAILLALFRIEMILQAS